MKLLKNIAIGIASLLVVVALAVGVWWAVTPTSASLAQSADPTAEPAPSTDEPAAAAQKGMDEYQSEFFQKLAAKLGVTVDKFKEAFSGAYQETVDQAVADGNLAENRATDMKEQMQERLDQGEWPGVFGGRGSAERGGMMGRGGNFGMRGGLGLDSFARALSMTETDLRTELQAGKTIAEVAEDKSIDLATVKTSVLADLKTSLDQAVTDGKLTQTQADKIYTQMETNFDTMVTQNGPMGAPFGGGHMNGPRGNWPGNSPDAQPELPADGTANPAEQNG